MLRTWWRSYVRVNVLRRGLSGNSRLWMAIGMGLTVRRLYRRFGGKEQTRAFGEVLAPGEQLVITHTAPPLTPRRLKRYRRTAAQTLAPSEPQ